MFVSLRVKLLLLPFLLLTALILALFGLQQYFHYRQLSAWAERTQVRQWEAAGMLLEGWADERVRDSEIAAAAWSATGEAVSRERLEANQIRFYGKRMRSGEAADCAAPDCGWIAHIPPPERLSTYSHRARGVRPDCAGEGPCVVWTVPFKDAAGWAYAGDLVFGISESGLRAKYSEFAGIPIGLTPSSAAAVGAGFGVWSWAAAGADTGNRVSLRLNTLDLDVALAWDSGGLKRQMLVFSAVSFVLVLAALGALLLLLWGVFDGVLRRIEELARFSVRVAGGNFNQKLSDKTKDEIGRLAVAFGQMADDLNLFTRKLEQTVKEREALAKELQIAAELQRRALPEAVPLVPRLKVSAMSIPAQSVGGDYYDFVLPGDGKFGFVIADAAGKGFPGSLYMTQSRSVFRLISGRELSPSRLLADTNNYLAENPDSQRGMFITYVFGVYDAAKKSFCYANAGHFPPLWYRMARDEFIALESTGLPVGIFAGTDYAEETLDLSEGDVLILYTDGVIEARSDSGELFGIERVKDIVRACRAMDSDEIAARIREAIKAFAGGEDHQDDLTLMVLKLV